MIRTATPEDLERIAARMFSPIREEFSEEFRNLHAAVGLLAQAQEKADGRTTEYAEEASIQQKRVAFTLTESKNAHDALTETVAALAIRTTAMEHLVEAQKEHIDSNSKLLMAKMVEILAAFARIENTHGK